MAVPPPTATAASAIRIATREARLRPHPRVLPLRLRMDFPSRLLRRKFPDFLQMRAHGLACRLRLALLNRLQDPLMVTLAAFRRAFNLEQAYALFPQQAHDGIEQRQNQG